MRGEVAAPASALCSLRASDARSSPWSQLRGWVEEENEAGNDLGGMEDAAEWGGCTL